MQQNREVGAPGAHAPPPHKDLSINAPPSNFLHVLFIYVLLLPNTCSELLMLGSNWLQCPHLKLIPLTCDYQWLLTWWAALQKSRALYFSSMESKYKVEYKYGLRSNLRAPNFSGEHGACPQTTPPSVCVLAHASSSVPLPSPPHLNYLLPPLLVVYKNALYTEHEIFKGHKFSLSNANSWKIIAVKTCSV